MKEIGGSGALDPARPIAVCLVCKAVVEGESCPTCHARTVRFVREKAALPAPVNGAAKAPIARGSLERTGDALTSGASDFFGEIAKRSAALVTAIESDARREKEEDPHDEPDDPRDDAALEASRAVFAREGHAVVGAGVDALSALDDDEEAQGLLAEGRPLGALQVFWFIGTILVLAGSVMGVREAWRTLSGVTRQLVIGGALFVYHVLFVVLALLLAKRSRVTGRVLSGIACGLLPIAFVAVASAVGTDRRVGIPFAAALTIASIGTLRFAGRAFEDSRQKLGYFVAAAVAPSLVLELPLAGAPTAMAFRIGAPFLALAPIALASVKLRADLARARSTRASYVALAAAAYGALAVLLFAAFGGPLDDAIDFSSGTDGQLFVTMWIGLFAAIGWYTARALESPRALPRLAVVLVLLSIALVASSTLAAAVARLTQDPPLRGVRGFLPFALGLVATAMVAWEQRRRLGVIHLLAPLAVLTVVTGARAVLPQEVGALGYRSMAMLPATTAIVPAAFLALSSLSQHPARRRWSAAWGIVASCIILATTFALEIGNVPSSALGPGVAGPPLVVSAGAAAAIAIAAHFGARAQRSWMHVFGALALFGAACAIAIPMRAQSGYESAAYVCVALGVAYGVAAFFYPALLANKSDPRRPLDDISLFAALGALAFAIYATPTSWALTTSAAAARALLPRAWPLVFAGSLLLARSIRDASALLVVLACAAFALSVRIVLSLSTSGEHALVAGIGAGFFLALAALRPPDTTPARESRWGRPIAGVVPLPLGARGLRLLDGAALAGIALAIFATGFSCMWIAGAAARLERTGVIVGMLAVIIAALVAFGTRAAEIFRARGSVVTLWLAGAAIAVCAIGNRIGRPLPPAIVGRNLSVIAIGVWALARVIARYGPKVAEKLGKPAHGPHYHLVPHAGLLALSLLLFVDAWLVGAPTFSRALAITPPLLYLGAAVGGILLYRSSGITAFLHFALASLFFFMTVAFAQHAITGPSLLPLDPPGGRWVPSALAPAMFRTNQWLDPTQFIAAPDTENALWSRALFGSSLYVTIAAALVLLQSRVAIAGDVIARRLLGRPEEEHPRVHTALSVWACIGALLLGMNLSFVPSLVPSLFLVAGGVMLVLARGRDQLGSAYRAIVVVVGAPLVVHALATRAPFVPAWAGPVLAALPLAISIASTVAARRRERGVSHVTDTELGIGALVAGFYSIGALAYALASGATTDPSSAVFRVIGAASDALGFGFSSPPWSLATALLVLAIAAAFGASIWRGGIATIAGIFPPILLGLAGVLGTVAFAFVDVARAGGDLGILLVTNDGALTGATLAIAALVSHVASVLTQKLAREDLAKGLGAGRDLLLGALLVVVGLFVYRLSPDAPRPITFPIGPTGVLALGVAVLVAVDAAIRGKKGRHVMYVETALVALYAFATREVTFRPEIHAILGLGYGFSLLGVAVVARRNGIVSVSIATRRFAAILPLMIALFVGVGVGDTLAMIALGSSVLYGAISFFEKSRIFGSLAALAANFALLVFALAQGLDGIEVYVGPLGLLVSAVTQLFSPKLDVKARTFARVIGGLLLYLPAGVKLTFGLGRAEGGVYAVVFGAVCLLGIVVGIVLRVRAYLALGTVFFTLDVIANLVNAGLRDHRVGFVLLSVTGLAILGVMIMVTMKREEARALLRRWRGRFRAWE